MKALFGFVVILLAGGFGLLQARAEFTSLYVFGDGVCTTTDNMPIPALEPVYYGNRFCNGRVWVEVLAQWQGVTYESNKNWSYFGQDSGELAANVNAFEAPADAATALFIVWASNADFVESIAILPPPYSSGDLAAWTNLIHQSLTNHYQALTNLYQKGARTLVLPTASDITQAPTFGLSPEDQGFIRARVTQFNSDFSLLVSNLVAASPGLTAVVPDSFALFDDVLTNPADYGITVTGIDAVTDLFPPELDGPGADYAFWDDLHPSAKLQQHLAELVQKMLASATVTSISAANGTNQLTIINVPAGEAGQVEVSTDLLTWAAALSFTNVGTTGTLAIPGSGAREFYRLLFPLTWAWP
jgi:hypothetical protein